MLLRNPSNKSLIFIKKGIIYIKKRKKHTSSILIGSKFFSILRQVGSSSFGIQVSIKVVSTLSVVSDVVPNHSNRIKKF